KKKTDVKMEKTKLFTNLQKNDKLESKSETYKDIEMNCFAEIVGPSLEKDIEIEKEIPID
ncbi:18_t:CDS:1, partial [Gigaspora margarita]